jgi:hypothetical protein
MKMPVDEVAEKQMTEQETKEKPLALHADKRAQSEIASKEMAEIEMPRKQPSKKTSRDPGSRASMGARDFSAGSPERSRSPVTQSIKASRIPSPRRQHEATAIRTASKIRSARESTAKVAIPPVMDQSAESVQRTIRRPEPAPQSDRVAIRPVIDHKAESVQRTIRRPEPAPRSDLRRNGNNKEIHVSIGTIEVRASGSRERPAHAEQRPAIQAQGFGSYRRIRNYINWGQR